MESVGSAWLWGGFGLFVVVMLVLDLGVFHRKAHAVSSREAIIWSAVWVGLAMLFNAFDFWRWGSETGQAFLTGYVIEKALSVDNLFVFYVIFNSFRVEAAYQHRLLFWGIIGALVLRAGMVWGGSALLTELHWVVYVFGAVLLATGLKMLVRREETPHPEKSRMFRLLRKVMPTTERSEGSRLFLRENGVLKATPLFLVLLLIESSDVVFAVDSILAIFAITTDPFIVFTSNIFAILGLRSLYFLLASGARRFAYLQPGLALVLLFVGLKMVISPWYKVPVLLSLSIVFLLLGGSIGASIWRSRKEAKLSAQRP